MNVLEFPLNEIKINKIFYRAKSINLSNCLIGMKAIDARAIRTTGFSISVHILSYEYVLCIKLAQRIHVMHLQQNTMFALKTVNDC